MRRGALRGDDRRGERASTPFVPTLLDKALVYVTGKGGAGKTTVAAALGPASEYEVLARELSPRRPA